MKIAVALMLTAWLAGALPARAAGTQLLQAVATCQPDAVRHLLEAGAPLRGPGGEPISRWLASGKGCTDARALEVAKLLAGHGARFDAGQDGPSLLVNLAPRHLPQTLRFLATQPGAGDPTAALRAIARGDDLDSMRALLEAGADPLAGPARSSALLEEALADRVEVVSELMKHVHEPQSVKVQAAYEAAARRGSTKVMEALTAGGFKPAPPTAPGGPRCPRSELTANESKLLAKVGIHPAPGQCKRVQTCGELLLVDCNAAADGPAYYLDVKAEKVLSTCGGACMRGCTHCPPPAWTCDCRL